MGRIFKVVFNRPASLYHNFFFLSSFFFNYESEYLTINNKARELLKNNSVIVSVPNRAIEIIKNTTEVLKIFATTVRVSTASLSTSGNTELQEVQGK